MKITIDTIEKKAKAAEAARREMYDAENQAATEIQELRNKADAAADAGDADGYIAIQEEIRRAEGRAYVRKAQLQKIAQALTEADVREAWDNYVSSFNKNLDAKLAEFNQAKAAALAEYRAAVALQKEACKIRERIARYVGVDIGVLTSALDDMFPMTGIPYNGGLEDVTLRCGALGALDKDLAFAVAQMSKTPLKLSQNSDAQDMISVVKNRRSK